MYLVLGSCRVLVTMSYSKYNCLNTYTDREKIRIKL